MTDFSRFAKQRVYNFALNKLFYSALHSRILVVTDTNLFYEQKTEFQSINFATKDKYYT